MVVDRQRPSPVFTKRRRSYRVRNAPTLHELQSELVDFQCAYFACTRNLAATAAAYKTTRSHCGLMPSAKVRGDVDRDGQPTRAISVT